MKAHLELLGKRDQTVNELRDQITGKIKMFDGKAKECAELNQLYSESCDLRKASAKKLAELEKQNQTLTDTNEFKK